MKWIEEKQALYRRNQELVGKVCPEPEKASPAPGSQGLFREGVLGGSTELGLPSSCVSGVT